jgi:molybdate transport system ATP-binding protein
VRNQLRGTVVSLSEDPGGTLVELDAGGTHILSRVTTSAARELELRPGLPVWMLVKAVSVSRHSLRNAALPDRRADPAPPAA